MSNSCREQDKAAKLAAKEEVKQARDRDKMENRASKGDSLSLHNSFVSAQPPQLAWSGAAMSSLSRAWLQAFCTGVQS